MLLYKTKDCSQVTFRADFIRGDKSNNGLFLLSAASN